MQYKEGFIVNLKPWMKSILSVVVIVAGGFILFNVAFLLAAFVFNGIGVITGTMEQGPGIIGTGAYLLLLLLISWLVFRSKLGHLAKATYLTMPLMAVLILTGVRLYQQPQWVVFGTGAVIVGAVTFYIYRKKLPWIYYFATFYVAALAVYIVLAGIEI
jgi:hypothetical protein